ncbi:unnamed protein product, partial [Mesorhabditis spiculigera]
MNSATREDNKISRLELGEYFVKINQQSTALRRGFKHDFRETTFLTPTTCSHCTKLLWGFLRQGCKCKDCGLAVHAPCKDSAVAECRRRNSSGGLAEWLTSPRGDVNGSFRKKLFLSYNDGRSMSAEDDQSQLVSLAMEEVFEDDSSSQYELCS